MLQIFHSGEVERIFVKGIMILVGVGVGVGVGEGAIQSVIVRTIRQVSQNRINSMT